MNLIMKRIIFLLFLMPLVVQAQSETQLAIRKVLDQQAADWNHGNLDAFMQGYWNNDSLRFIGKKGITYGWKPVLENYRKSYGNQALMGVLTFDKLKIELLGEDAALVTGSWRVVTKTSEQGGWYSLIFKYIDNRWVIVLDHTS
jgi:hypothetical protein